MRLLLLVAMIIALSSCSIGIDKNPEVVVTKGEKIGRLDKKESK